MIIQHNMESSNANRQVGITNWALSKSTEKLSSGYRINRAADDAAGLVISEEMRGQIRGLNRSAQNTEEGISFCNVADGGMQELENIIQRMRELCVQAANDTNVKEDREAIQSELDVLKQEVDRITNDTEYNTIKVFRPNMVASVYDVDLGTGHWEKIETITYEVKDNNWGITNILGSNHIYNGTHLSYGLQFSGSGWHTTGKDMTYYGTGSSTLLYGSTWSDTESYINTKYGVTISQHSANTSETFVSSDGKSNISVSYGRYDTTGERYVTGVRIENYDKAVTDTDKQLLSTEKVGYASGGGYAGYSALQNGTFNATWLDFSGLGTDYNIESLDGEGFNSTCAHCSRHYSITLLAKSSSATGLTTNADGVGYKFNNNPSAPNLSVDISNCTTGDEIVKTIMSAVQSASYMTDHLTQYAYNDSEPAKLYIYDNCSSSRITENSFLGIWEPQARNSSEQFPHIVTSQKWVPDKSRVTEYKLGEFNIQVGANSTQMVGIDKPWLTASILGVTDVQVIDFEDTGDDSGVASESISVCDNALNILNNKRSYIGAVTNRLEHAYDNDLNESENMQSAESLLRDAKIAEEMVQYSSRSIILQAGQSMLAQTNSSKDGILTLLQR